MTYLLLLLAALFGRRTRVPRAEAEALRLAGQGALDVFVEMLERYHERGGPDAFTHERAVWANQWLDFIGALACRHAPRAYARVIKSAQPPVFTLRETVLQLQTYIVLLAGPAERPARPRPPRPRAAPRRERPRRAPAFALRALELSG